MRLEKHTEEEIEQAKEEAGKPRDLSPEELEAWKAVHDKMNLDLVQKANERMGCQIINLDLVVMPHLSQDAQRIAHCKGASTVLELMYNPVSDHHFPWSGSGLTGYEHITDDVFKGTDLRFERRTVLCQYLTKWVEIDKGDTEKLEYWVKRFALLFNKLAEAKKIKYGMLAPFMALPLADLAAENAGEQALRVAREAGARLTSEQIQKAQEIKERVRAESKTRRLMLLAYPYTHCEREELNEWLGSEVFVEEGDLGSNDWTNLPDV